jgi:hypothetical protein
MTDIDAIEVPPQAVQLRSQLAGLEQQQTTQQAALARAEEAVRAVQRTRTPPAQLTALGAQVTQLRAQVSATTQQIGSVTAQLVTLGFPPQPAGPQIASMSAAVPIALLPLRLETRWINTGAGMELWIRILPDQVHSNSFESALTDNEIAWGEQFWLMRWCAGGDSDREAEAWRQLMTRYGPVRGAWIARSLRPSNPQAAPSSPVSDPSGLTTQPQFPTPSAQTSPWSRGALADLLPERFLAIGYSGTARACAAWGQAVASPLVTGPAPGATMITVDGLSVDADLRWLFDFNTACQVGMGIKMPLPAGVTQLDRLVVLGARPSQSPAGGADALGSLLTAHQYTDGLEVLAPGAATSNTALTRSALAPAADTPSPQGWLMADPTAGAPTTASDGGRIATSLGLPATAMLDVPGAARGHDGIAEMMLRALWPATGDYFLRQLLIGERLITPQPASGPQFEDVIDPPQLETVRTWVLDNVRPGGPLATIRVGNQPYGLIPAGSLETWRPAAGTVNAVALKALMAARGGWLSSSAGVPRAGGPNGAVDELLGVISMDAVSSSYAGRPWFGPDFVDAMTLGQADPTLQSKRDNARQQLSGFQVGLHDPSGPPDPRGPRLVNGMFSSDSRLLQTPFVDRDGPLERPLRPVGNYITWLLTSEWHEIAAQERAAPAPTKPADTDQPGQAADGSDVRPGPHYPLLFYLLRASVLLEAARAANQLIHGKDLDLIDAEFLNLQAVGSQNLTPTAFTVLSHVMPDGKTAGEHVWGRAMQAGAPARIVELRQALQMLAHLPAALLDLYARQGLDLCSHRLDAWITSLAWQRLRSARAAGTAGLYVGAYGWLEALAPSTAGGSTVPTATPIAAAHSGGWIHAPSLPQATTAAILRAGEQAHAGQGPGRRLEINLSSRRARQAAWLLDGVRVGNSPGALLGYRFERLLQETGNGGFVAVFRQLYPAVAGKLTALPTGDRPAAAPCVDGMALLRAHQAGTIPWAQVQAAQSGVADPQTVITRDALEPLAELADAVSDAVTAEAVHHATLGNTTRIAGSLEAIDRGEAPPPELDFIRTPQSGVAINHRVGILRAVGSGDPTGGVAGWPAAAALSPRAAAEPVLSAIAAGLLPVPSRVRFTIEPEISRPLGGVPGPLQPPPRPPGPLGPPLGPFGPPLRPPVPPGPPPPRTTLADVGTAGGADQQQVGPLDIIYGSAGANGRDGSELEQRALAHARALRPGVSDVTVDFGRKPDWTDDDVSLAELAELAAALRDAFAHARPMTPADLVMAELETQVEVDGASVVTRAQNLAQTLGGLVSALDNALGASAPDPATLMTAMAPLASFGIAEALLVEPSGGAADPTTGLVDQANRVATVAAERQSAANAAIATAAAATDNSVKARAGTEALQAMFGSGFLVLPPFTPDTSSQPGGSSVAPDLSTSAALTAGVSGATETFLAQAAAVQRNVDRWQDARLLSGALRPLDQRGAADSLVVAQAPIDAGETWVALPSAQAPRAGRTSWVLDTAVTTLANTPVAGLLVDQWVDVVPQSTLSTGIAFGYAAPATQPPQAILLAVPPDARPNWSVEAIERVILETLDLARIRAVDPDSLQSFGHIVPALFMAMNQASDSTVSTDLSQATVPTAPRPAPS